MPHNNIHTAQGQAWDQIAKREYGAEIRMDVLLTGNPEDADTLLFSGGRSLALPAAPAEAPATENLPPWERLEV